MEKYSWLDKHQGEMEQELDMGDMQCIASTL